MSVEMFCMTRKTDDGLWQGAIQLMVDGESKGIIETPIYRTEKRAKKEADKIMKKVQKKMTRDMNIQWELKQL